MLLHLLINNGNNFDNKYIYIKIRIQMNINQNNTFIFLGFSNYLYNIYIQIHSFFFFLIYQINIKDIISFSNKALFSNFNSDRIKYLFHKIILFIFYITISSFTENFII